MKNTHERLIKQQKESEYPYWRRTGFSALIIELVLFFAALYLMIRYDIGSMVFSYSSILLLNTFSIILLSFVYLSIVRGQEISNTTYLFRLMIFWDVIYLFLNTYTWLVNGHRLHPVFAYTISISVFIDSIWMYYLFWLFMRSWIGQDNEETIKLDRIIRIISMIGVALIFGNIWGKYYYTIDATGLYEKSDTYWTNMIVPVFLVCIFVYYILKQKISHWNKLFFLSYPILPIFGALFTINEKGPTLLCVMVFLSIFLMYCNLFVAKQWENIQFQAELARRETEIANEKAKVVISQIKPHFLYNSLVAIMEIEGNPPQTKKALKNFAKYLRGNIRSLDSGNTIPFSREIEHVKQYTSLEMLRFGDISVTYELKEEDFMIPPLTVQMLVENAILHGVSVKEGGGNILVEQLKSDTEDIVRVVDDGCGFDLTAIDLDEVDEHGKTHVGIKNVERRLRMVNGSLQIASEKDHGTVAEIHIPREMK